MHTSWVTTSTISGILLRDRPASRTELRATVEARVTGKGLRSRALQTREPDRGSVCPPNSTRRLGQGQGRRQDQSERPGSATCAVLRSQGVNGKGVTRVRQGGEEAEYMHQRLAIERPKEAVAMGVALAETPRRRQLQAGWPSQSFQGWGS